MDSRFVMWLPAVTHIYARLMRLLEVEFKPNTAQQLILLLNRISTS